jgi:N-acetylglutamate synthase-like GNAT family acetyltransferase
LIKLRPFRPEDFDLLLDLANQAVPFAPQENIEWLAYRQAFDESIHLRRHYMAEENGQAVGYGCLEQQGENPQTLRIYVVCAPANIHGEVGDLLYARLILDARELGVERLWARELQEDTPIAEFFIGRGFVEIRRFAIPDYPPMLVFELELPPE